MGHHHHHHHHHHDASAKGEKSLWLAVGANMLLTLAQIIGGLVSGSLSLIADALHNFSDAASLLIALIAIRIGRKPPDQFKTFGYKRAETIAALINLTALVITGLYLAIEACRRFYNPEPIDGWLMVYVAGFALAVDVFTAMVTYAQSKHSMNMRAAFLHNITDALASLGVIITGSLILLYGWVWTDAAMTLLISAYVLWHGCAAMPQVIHLLMEGAPRNIAVKDVIAAMQSHEGVENIHHVHIWQLDEHRNALEAHVVIHPGAALDQLKNELKAHLADKFHVHHSTLEFENVNCEESAEGC